MFKKFFIFILVIFYFSKSFSNEVDKIQINGNDRIGAETIIVYGDIKLENKFDEIEINRILKNLYETNFFEDVVIKIEANTLRIDVKEYPTINQLIIVGEEKKKI